MEFILRCKPTSGLMNSPIITKSILTLELQKIQISWTTLWDLVVMRVVTRLRHWVKIQTTCQTKTCGKQKKMLFWQHLSVCHTMTLKIGLKMNCYFTLKKKKAAVRKAQELRCEVFQLIPMSFLLCFSLSRIRDNKVSICPLVYPTYPIFLCRWQSALTKTNQKCNKKL